MPRVKKLIAPVLLLALFLIWLFPEKLGLSAWQAQTISGAKVVVRDGDTLTLEGHDVRLFGLDAPEFTQICKKADGADWACGKAARAEMLGLVRGHTISCEERAKDKFGRFVSTCRDEDGRDLGRAMVERGLAISMNHFEQDGPYAADEASAKAAKRGIWQGKFDPPSSWRAGHPGHQHTPQQD